ncbi:protein TolQ [Bartonella sp. DGB1]|uniref:protein TolQ n=1 Tax=Bartonella sp. DGB1 TaxID=3239807 RepID=UPI003526AAD1
MENSSSSFLNNFSTLELFLQASWPVKFIMLLLIATSIWSWTIIFDRIFFLNRQKKSMQIFEDNFYGGAAIDKMYRVFEGRKTIGLASIFMAAIREWKRAFASNNDKVPVDLDGRLNRVIESSLNKEIERLNNRLAVLATIGSAAPFVGLLGTVIGIIDAFQSIAISKNTSLAVVAPGIAEALLATALGLIVAIPAVVAYNRFSEKILHLSHRLEIFADDLAINLSRQAVELSILDHKSNLSEIKKSSGDE